MCNDDCKHKPKGSISLKFNSGSPALLYRGEGLALISQFGLHTEYELAVVKKRYAALEQENDALKDQLAAATEKVKELTAEETALRALWKNANLAAHELAADIAAAGAREKAMREALTGLVEAVSAQLARGEDTTPGDFERAWQAACAALAATAPEVK